MFKGRNLVIATMHHKEQVIAPIMEETLGVKCMVSTINTDAFGTFTTEVERTESALETARKKCLQAMLQTNCDLAIASEGSFGPHPSIFFAQADEEIVLLMDKKNELEIWVKEISLSTNFSAAEVAAYDELVAFAEAAGFPEHGLILRSQKADLQHIKKGITEWNALRESYHLLKNNNGVAWVETDMRAMFNPTRMQVISTAAQKLAEKVNSKCPSCTKPGFGVSSAKPGLPCSLCGLPTHSILAHIYSCANCGYEEEKKYPKGKKTEEPTYCNFCNP